MYRHIVFHKSREKHTSGNEMSLSEQYSLREQFAHNVINVGYSILVIWPQFRVWLLSNLKEFKIRTLKKNKDQSPHGRHAIKILWQILQPDEKYFPEAKWIQFFENLFRCCKMDSVVHITQLTISQLRFTGCMCCYEAWP